MYSAPIPDGFAFMAMAAAVGLLVPIGLYQLDRDHVVGAVLPGTFDLALGSAVLLAFGLAGQLGTSVIPVGLQFENTTASEQDTIMVVVGFTLAAFAALHYWLPKITGRLVAEGPAKAASALILGGAITLRSRCSSRAPASRRLPLLRGHRPLDAQPDRLGWRVPPGDRGADRAREPGGLLQRRPSGGARPWHGSTLEWFALSPPPPHNFDAVPDVRSPEPMRDIREAIREREAAYVPPVPLEPAAPPTPEPVGDPPILRSMGSRRASRRGAADLPRFRRLVTATIVATFVLILIGGIAVSRFRPGLRPGGLGHPRLAALRGRRPPRRVGRVGDRIQPPDHRRDRLDPDADDGVARVAPPA